MKWYVHDALVDDVLGDFQDALHRGIILERHKTKPAEDLRFVVQLPIHTRDLASLQNKMFIIYSKMCRAKISYN